MAKTNTKKYQVIQVFESSGNSETVLSDISYENNAERLTKAMNDKLSEHDAKIFHYEFQEQE
jgi:hypothetical protein